MHKATRKGKVRMLIGMPYTEVKGARESSGSKACRLAALQLKRRKNKKKLCALLLAQDTSEVYAMIRL